MEPGLILQHEESGPPALFAEWCERMEAQLLGSVAEKRRK